MSKTASPSSLLVGDRITFTLKIDNLGTVTATNVVVTDTLPYTTSVSEVLTNRQVIASSLVPTTSTFIFTGTPTRGIWQVPSLAPKATAQAQFTALVSSAATRNATYSNTIGLEPTSPPDPNPSNDKAIVYFETDLIRVTGQVWNEREYRGIPGATVVLTDSASHTYSAISDSAGKYTFNSSTTTPIAAGRALVKATAVGFRMDPAPSVFTTTLGYQATQDINMVYAPELEITKVASVSSAAPLDSVAYTITVANTGRMPAYYVVITDTFPTGLTYESDTLTPSSGAITRTVPQTTGPTKIIWAFAALGAGESVSFRMNTTVVAGYTANATIKNTVDVGTITTEGVTTNNTASASFTVKAVAAPRISKTGTPEQAKLNEYFTFVITVKNIGNQEATTLVVEDSFPSFLDLSVSISYSSGVTPVPTNQTSGRDVKVSITKIPANGYVTITIRATVNSNLLDNRILTTNVAYLTWGTTELESNSVSYTAYRTSLPDTGGWPDWAGDPPVFGDPAQPAASNGLVNATIIIATLLILCGVTALIYGTASRPRNPSWAGWFIRTGLILSAAALVFGLGAWELARLSNPEQPSGVAQPVTPQQVAQAPTASRAPNIKTIPTVPNLPVEEQYWLLPPNPEEPQTLPDYPIPTPTALPTPSAPDSPLPDASPVTWIEIPAAQVNTVVKYVPYDGLTWKIGGLKQEVAWMGSTSWPGLGGNTALAGHVTLSSGGYGPFRYLYNLKPGDIITLYTEKNTYTYHVRSLEVLPGYELGPALPTDQNQLTLITCTNWNKDEKRYTQRLVVYSDLVGVQPYAQPKRGN